MLFHPAMLLCAMGGGVGDGVPPRHGVPPGDGVPPRDGVPPDMG